MDGFLNGSFGATLIGVSIYSSETFIKISLFFYIISGKGDYLYGFFDRRRLGLFFRALN